MNEKGESLMKKASACLFSLLLAAGLVWNAAAKERAVEDFDHFTDAAAMDERVYPWEEGGSIKLTLTDRNAVSGKALKAVPGGGGYGYIMIDVPENQQDWTGMEFFRFHVAATGGTVADPTYFGLTVQIDNSSDPDKENRWERWYGAPNKPYYIIHDDGTEETQRFTDNGIVVDDGRSFWVEIPLKSFDSYGWSMVDDELQLTDITRIYFAFDTDFFKNKDIIIDSISIVGERVKDPAAPTQTPTPPPTTAPDSGSQPPEPTTTAAPEPTESQPGETASSTTRAAATTGSTPSASGTRTSAAESVDEKGGNVWIWWVVGGVIIAAAGAGTALYFLRFRKPKA